jgi:hypothetical protein
LDNTAWLAGLAGACTVTLLNEGIRQVDDEAPRLDFLGMRVLADVVSPEHLRAKAMAADIAANTLYYSAVGLGSPERAPLIGAAIGLAAGAGAVLLPGQLGYGDDVTNWKPKTRAMSVGYYAAAGLVAGLLYRAMARD